MRKNALITIIGLFIFGGMTSYSVALSDKDIKNIDTQLERLCLKKRACVLSSSASKKLDFTGRQALVKSLSNLCKSVKKEYSVIKRFDQPKQLDAAYSCLDSLQSASCDTVLQSENSTIGCNAYQEMTKRYQPLVAQ